MLSIGQRLPVLTGAVSTAILSRLQPAEVERILVRTRRPDQPGPDAARLETVRQAGWAFAFSVRVPGGSAIAAPLIGPDGQALEHAIAAPHLALRLDGVDRGLGLGLQVRRQRRVEQAVGGRLA